MADEMKKCKYCGREIGAIATFCWYCGRELEARPERPEPTQKENKLDRWLLLGVGSIAVMILLFFVLSSAFR
jgi:predicted amidophosphoribosyltransferase